MDLTRQIHAGLGIALLALVTITPDVIHAHQPRLTNSLVTEVTQPEISKVFFGTLAGTPHTYRINATHPFELYVNVLVPHIPSQSQDVSASVTHGPRVTKLDAQNVTWTHFWEPFGRNWYWRGPTYKKSGAPAGEYEIRVWSTTNHTKYSLAIGQTETFGIREIIDTISVMPELKRTFFNQSPITFLLSPFSWIYLLLIFTLAIVSGTVYRFTLSHLSAKTGRRVHKNIGWRDRLFRGAIGIVLLIWALTTSWNPIIFFMAAFAFYETLSSWCGFYALTGKNTCQTSP